MNKKLSITAVAAMLAMVFSKLGEAQTVSSEDFTGASSANSWYYYNGACLTAGTSAGTGSPGVTPGKIPSCKSILPPFYSLNPDNIPGFLGARRDTKTTR